MKRKKTKIYGDNLWQEGIEEEMELEKEENKRKLKEWLGDRGEW